MSFALKQAAAATATYTGGMSTSAGGVAHDGTVALDPAVSDYLYGGQDGAGAGAGAVRA